MMGESQHWQASVSVMVKAPDEMPLIVVEASFCSYRPQIGGNEATPSESFGRLTERAPERPPTSLIAGNSLPKRDVWQTHEPHTVEM